MSKKVLYVDDDPILRRSLARYLKSVGWEVLLAENPIQARDFYSQVDLVVSDWTMPEGGGARVLEESVKPVIVYSGEATLGPITGAEAFVYKGNLASTLEATMMLVWEKYHGDEVFA